MNYFLFAVVACVAVVSVSGAPRLLEIPKNTPEAQQFLDSILADNSIPVPDRVDWRDVPGRVSPVKQQGFCASSWAFAAIGALEGQQAPQSKKPHWDDVDFVQLSAQNLVDCTSKNDGCYRGWVHYGLEQVQIQGGIESEFSYPYEHSKKECRFNKSLSVMSANGYAFLPVGDELLLEEVVAKFGPVAVTIDASELMHMGQKTGVYYSDVCKNDIRDLFHGALIVGYGNDVDGGDYWITKHSWGRNFGDNGYVKMARRRGNNCGIATLAVIPTFAK